ncbi:MAG TPA: helix-turn-helix transcriptional regulator [Jiangellaceae bacterium]|jgi:transcriptional regulator with XRE-family HTH domain|nr:helix-turn-helix transcriptional regulator [Jiangellaceae bacterium]
MTDLWGAQLEALGAYIRSQRQLADLTLREMAELANVSNPYLSQIERGMHQPSVRVLKAIAEALDLSAETLLVRAGLLQDDETDGEDGEVPTVEAAIRGDRRLSEEQKRALVAVYRSMCAPADASDERR